MIILKSLEVCLSAMRKVLHIRSQENAESEVEKGYLNKSEKGSVSRMW